jgi:hypothetical protein
MDSAIGTAARALSRGDAIAALKLVALRGDPKALALRGVAMAQLGELEHAATLLGRAARAFGAREPVLRARSVVARAEVALALRDMRGAARGVAEATALLARRGDALNAAMGRLVHARQLVLLGKVQEAARVLKRLNGTPAPPRFVALVELVAADIAMKLGQGVAAGQALERAGKAARASGIAALEGEVARASGPLRAPVVRYRMQGQERALTLSELEAEPSEARLVIDACRREARYGKSVVALRTRPILLELLVALAGAASGEVARDELIAGVFGARRANDSHRVRLRVEVGRLRKLLRGVGDVQATVRGFALVARQGAAVALLLPPSASEASQLASLLGGGEAWSTSALAAALGKSQRAVQRALSELEAAGKVRSFGAGRARRWVATPNSGFATTLLLVAPGSLS